MLLLGHYKTKILGDIVVNLRIQRVKNHTELEDKISDYIAMGYKIKRRQDDSAELWKRNYGSIFLHIILFCLSFFYRHIKCIIPYIQTLFTRGCCIGKN